jgi:hypothetical protein
VREEPELAQIMYTHVNKCKNDKIIVLENRDFKHIPTDEFQKIKNDET